MAWPSCYKTNATKEDGEQHYNGVRQGAEQLID